MTKGTQAALARDLAAMLSGTGIGMLELSTPEGTLVLRRGPAGATPSQAPPSSFTATGQIQVRSPGVGVFLHSHPLRSGPSTSLNASVAAGAVLGLLRVGALLTPVLAPRAGVVVAMLLPDGTAAGFGTPLVSLAPAPE